MIQKIFQSNFETGKNRQHQASVIINEWNLRKHLLEKESWRDFMDCPAIPIKDGSVSQPASNS